MTGVANAIILCGGAGLRLRSVTGDTPKAMAEISGRPFLELLLRQLGRHGFQRVVLAVGYQKDIIRSHFGTRAFGLSLEYSVETTPLGTGGAVRNAVDLVASDSVLIMNGDSYTPVNLSWLSVEHSEAKVDLSIVVVKADGRNDCGLLSLGPDQRIVGFKERQSSSGTVYINAGIYLATRALLHEIPAQLQLSLEEQLIPQWLTNGKAVRGFISQASCVDIGTPERYQRAQSALADVEIDESFWKTLQRQ